MATEYFIFDAETSRRMDLALWWKPNGSGYTTNLGAAGRYTEEQMEKHTRGRDGATVGIPCELAESVAVRVCDSSDVRRLVASKVKA